MKFTSAKFQTKAEMIASERKSEFAAVLDTSEIYRLNEAGDYEFLGKFYMTPATPPNPRDNKHTFNS